LDSLALHCGERKTQRKLLCSEGFAPFVLPLS
jgi:hypothetical protein